MIFHGSIDMDADVDRVWAVLTDETLLPRWHPLSASISYPEGSRYANPVGQSFELVYGSGIREVRQRAEYLTYTCPTSLAVRAYDPDGSVLARYDLTPIGTSTRLRLTIRPEYSGRLWLIVCYVLFPASYWMSWRALRRLKALAES